MLGADKGPPGQEERPEPLPLRPHHLLCLLTYIGKGYSDAFVANMDEVVARLNKGKTQVRLVQGPDSLCLYAKGGMCDRNASGECGADEVKRDDRVLTLLASNFPLSYGQVLTLDAAFVQKLRELRASGVLQSACFDCPWNELCISVSGAYKGVRLFPPGASD